jgi:hypothetical protein
MRKRRAGWKRIGKAVLWCIQQRNWFTHKEFARETLESETCSRPCRSLDALVEIGMLEKDDTEHRKQSNKPQLYKSKFVVKCREELDEEIAKLMRLRE